MVEYVTGKGARLGECPVWDDLARALYWIDCTAPALHRLDPETGATADTGLDRVIGSFGLRRTPDDKGGAVAAFEDGFKYLDLSSGAAAAIVDPEAGRDENRFNDGRCDPGGRFWAGTMNRNMRAPTGSFYRLEPSGHADELFNDVSVTNGVAFGPDGRTLYFADSPKGVVLAFDLDPETGSLSNKRIFASADAVAGFPDGATVDADGCLWSARYMGGSVARFTPEGKLDKVVELPVARVTSCVFGDPDLKTLYVTTASDGMSAEELNAQPLAGGLFAIRPGAQGVAEPRFAG